VYFFLKFSLYIYVYFFSVQVTKKFMSYVTVVANERYVYHAENKRQIYEKKYITSRNLL